MKPSTGAAVRLHRIAVRDRPESLSAFKWNACPPSPEYPALRALAAPTGLPEAAIRPSNSPALAAPISASMLFVRDLVNVTLIIIHNCGRNLPKLKAHLILFVVRSARRSAAHLKYLYLTKNGYCPMQLQYTGKTTSSNRLHWLVIGIGFSIAAIVGVGTIILKQLHQNTLHDVQASLLRQSLVLSETVDRTFQSADMVLTSVTERISNELPNSKNHSYLASQDFHIFLGEKTSGLPQINAIGIIDASGKKSIVRVTGQIQLLTFRTEDIFKQ